MIFISKVYKFRFDSNIGTIARYNKDGKLIDYSSFYYNSDRNISYEIIFDNKNNEAYRWKYEYDERGFLIKEEQVFCNSCYNKKNRGKTYNII